MKFQGHIVEGRKQSLYLGDLTEEVEREGLRLDRTPSWLLRKAWLLAREQIRQIEAPPRIDASEAGR